MFALLIPGCEASVDRTESRVLVSVSLPRRAQKEEEKRGLTGIAHDGSSQLDNLDPSLKSVSAVAGLLVQLADGARFRLLTLVDQASGEFHADAFDRRAVLKDTVEGPSSTFCRGGRKKRTNMGIEVGLFGCLRRAAIATASIPPSAVVVLAAISHICIITSRQYRSRAGERGINAPSPCRPRPSSQSCGFRSTFHRRWK
jgi:hypothetical protein